MSVRVPVDFEPLSLPHAPAFLHDIAPAGAAKRNLMTFFGRQKPQDINDDLYLLGRCTPAPVGHLRIKESADALEQDQPLGFARDDVITRDQRFLEYAYEQGAAIGGATGAGGEAPKLLMTQGVDGLLYPDAILPDQHARAHWFIKFARNQALKNDQDISRSEYLYYRALEQLGIDTVATADMVLEEGNKPGLWMRRFDRQITHQGVERLAVESIYSLAGVTVPGSAMEHLEVIRLLADLWRQNGQKKDIDDLVAEYLRRDRRRATSPAVQGGEDSADGVAVPGCSGVPAAVRCTHRHSMIRSNMATQKAFYSGISLQRPVGMHLESTVPSAPNVVFLAHGSRAACNDFQRIHSRIGNARRDYLHKCSTTISQNHAMVCIEDLQVRPGRRQARPRHREETLGPNLA